MVLDPGPTGLKPGSAEHFNGFVKAEFSSPGQHKGGISPQWQSCGTTVNCQPAKSELSSPCQRHSQSPSKFEQQHFGEIESYGTVSPKKKKESYGTVEESGHNRKRCKIHDSVHTITSQSRLSSLRGDSGFPGLVSTRDSARLAPMCSESSHCAERSTVSGPLRATSVSVNPLDEPSPLGLTLRKTPSLLDLISMKLAQGGTIDQGFSSPDSSAQDAAKNRTAKCLVPTAATQDKLKASNFPASSLKVGTWERVSRYEGDLVGKCYYAKRKLVWEVLESGLKSKIEIQWSDISAMKASCPENLPGTLEIEVSRPPLFFRETNPQPRKHTLWQATSDFTGGQATICKLHCLQFSEGVLNRHYEKLVQCDPRLMALVGGSLSSASPTSADFEHASWILEGKHQHLPMGHNSDSYDGHMTSQPSSFHPHLHARPVNAAVTTHGGGLSDPGTEGRSMKVQISDMVPQTSVFDHRSSDESGNSETRDLRLCEDFRSNEGINLMYLSARSIGEQGRHIPDLKPSRNNLFMMGENGLPPDWKIVDAIAQVLMGETSSMSTEQAIVPAAKEMSAQLVEELQLPHPVMHHEVLEGFCWSDATNHRDHPSGSLQGKSEIAHEVSELDLMISGAGNNSRTMKERLLRHRDPSVNSLTPCFSKNASTGDVLMNLPRITSLPQLFGTPQVPIGRYESSLWRPSYSGSEKLR